MRRRILVMLFVLVGLLLLVLISSYRYMGFRGVMAATAQADVDDCLRMARQIRQFSRRPTLAAEHEKLATETTGLIEKATGSAGIPPDGLRRITPEPPRQLGDTVYKEKPTQVLLRKVTLKQLVMLTHSLISADAGLHAKSIRLSAPQHDKMSDGWTAELVFTYLIYDPPRLER